MKLPTLRIVGIVLLLWAYGMNVHGVLGAWQEAHLTPEQAAREHLEQMQQRAQQSSTGHGGMDMGGAAGETALPPTPMSAAALALTALLLIAGVVLALIPIRLGAWYGVWATVVVWIAIAAPRVMNDPRCWQVLDPNRHGCHTFMLAVAIGVAGIVCCAVAGNLSPAGATASK